MYDNLDFTISKDLIPGTDLIQTIPQFLTNVSSQGVNQYGEYITGYLESLKVSISESRVKIYACSVMSI